MSAPRRRLRLTRSSTRPRLHPPPAAGGSATLSPCGRYRYRLVRVLARRGPTVAFVMLNPSTADAHHDDPTIRRCLGFARRWGFARLVVVNLFALRATDPRRLTTVADPVGPGNDRALIAAVRAADRWVCAWGGHGARHDRAAAALPALLAAAAAPPRILGLTASGQPRHPLYLPATTPLRVWNGTGAAMRPDR